MSEIMHILSTKFLFSSRENNYLKNTFFLKHGLFSAKPQRALKKPVFSLKCACLISLNKETRICLKIDVHLFKYTINDHVIVIIIIF